MALWGSITLLVVVLGVLGYVVARLRHMRSGGKSIDLGQVSDSWRTEQRAASDEWYR